jgi:prevent-host-death family protein
MGTAAPDRKRESTPRTEISADKARAVLGGLVNQAGSGSARVVLTRHGLPAAAIVSIDDLNALEARDVATATPAESL